MTLSRYMRFYSAEEIRLIADRIDQLVKRNRIVRLRPETAWLVERAVRAYAARPNRSEKSECGDGALSAVARIIGSTIEPFGVRRV